MTVFHVVWPQVVAFLGFFIYGSFFEWALHRFVMHRRTILSFPYELHALLHHRLFRADESFHALNDEMKEHVTFVPRDYLLLLCVHIPLFLAFEWFSGVPIVIGGSLATLSYIALFDILHWSFHVPNDRLYERHGWYRWIKRHHLLHHRYQNRNLNVVFPLADLFLGTLVLRPREGVELLRV